MGSPRMYTTLVRFALRSSLGNSSVQLFTGSPSMLTMRSPVCSRAAAAGDYFESRLNAESLAQVRQFRRRGLMIGIELKSKVQPVLEQLMARGVIALPAGATVLRLLPPLVIEHAQLDVVADHLRELLS